MRDESTRTESMRAGSMRAGSMEAGSMEAVTDRSVTMKDLLASCAAARIVSTPPAPDDREADGPVRFSVAEVPAGMPERPFGRGEAA
jgi:hypothetical protein